MEKEWSIPELLSTSTAFWKGCTLQSAVRLEVFTIINNDTLSLDEITKKMKADTRGTEMLLNALAAMDLLIKMEILTRIPGLLWTFFPAHQKNTSAISSSTITISWMAGRSCMTQ